MKVGKLQATKANWAIARCFTSASLISESGELSAAIPTAYCYLGRTVTAGKITTNE